jgi:putative membrane protein
MTADTAKGFTRSEWAVLIFTLGYVSGFAVYFFSIGNQEFIGYIGTMLAFMLLIGLGARAAEFPAFLLWALSFWGLAHMAGGSVEVDGAVLYAYRFLPLVGDGELTLLKYDQVVHFYGFAVAALVLRHILLRSHPQLWGSKCLFVYSFLGSMGLGALNEVIEFTAVVVLPDTNVGGYYNTGLDLVFNMAGAFSATLGATLLSRPPSPGPPSA